MSRYLFLFDYDIENFCKLLRYRKIAMTKIYHDNVRNSMEIKLVKVFSAFRCEKQKRTTSEVRTRYANEFIVMLVSCRGVWLLAVKQSCTNEKQIIAILSKIVIYICLAIYRWWKKNRYYLSLVVYTCPMCVIVYERCVSIAVLFLMGITSNTLNFTKWNFSCVIIIQLLFNSNKFSSN